MLAALVACLLAVPLPQAAPPKFRVVLLEDVPGMIAEPNSINSKGEMAGRLFYPSSSIHSSAYWAPDGSITQLEQPGSKSEASVYAINDSGVMVGAVLTADVYPVWTPRAHAVLWTLTEGGRRLPMPVDSFAVDINSAGDILVQIPNSLAVVLGRNGEHLSIEFPNGSLGGAGSLNDDRHVAGSYRKGALDTPYRWSPTRGFEALRMPSGFGFEHGYPSSIQRDGSVVGRCSGPGTFGPRAVAWDAAGQPHVLSTSLIHMAQSSAWDGNDNGWIVGYQFGISSTSSLLSSYGTLWIDGTPYEVEQLLEPGAVLEVYDASAVNDAGQIAGWGLVRGKRRAFRLDPI